MIGRYCSERPPGVIASSSRDMFVHYWSHSQISGEGFEAVYTQSDGNIELYINMIAICTVLIVQLI